MTNPMFNPQPNYSGVTIQIANPAVNVGDCARNCTNPQVYGGYIRQTGNVKNVPNNFVNGYYVGQQAGNVPQGNYITYPQGSYAAEYSRFQENVQDGNISTIPNETEQYAITNPNQSYPAAYPAQYYLNNYNYPPNGIVNGNETGNLAENNTNYNQKNRDYEKNVNRDFVVSNENNENAASDFTSYRVYAQKAEPIDNDLSRSNNIIGDIDERVAEEEKEKKNTKETKIVALTDEYIKSLENYLNNPNDEIRLMASKEVLKRLDEDKDRYNDAALNALLNKMMQDPNKLVRLASLSAFSAQLASGNDYTVKLLHNIQANPNADKEDVLQAADILLKMSAGVEVKNVPIQDKTKNEKE